MRTGELFGGEKTANVSNLPSRKSERLAGMFTPRFFSEPQPTR